MPKHKHSRHETKLGWLALLGVAFVIAFLLIGQDVSILNPKGLMAHEQRSLILFAGGLLLTAAVPTIFVLYFMAWKYRETNKTATYDAAQRHGKFFTFSIWAIPSLFMLVLGLVMWPATHRLEPRKDLVSDAKPVKIQVIAMRWKWVFIYPEQHIATVNYIEIPTDVPVQFDLTADEVPMSSFWIPHLSGQLYAMTGHVNRLNIMANEPGDYPGSSAEINGAGFAGMKFTTHAGSQDDFNIWVQRVKSTSHKLDADEYDKLVKPSENNSISFYSDASPDLYDALLLKYNGSHNHSHVGTETE